MAKKKPVPQTTTCYYCAHCSVCRMPFAISAAVEDLVKQAGDSDERFGTLVVPSLNPCHLWVRALWRSMAYRCMHFLLDPNEKLVPDYEVLGEPI